MKISLTRFKWKPAPWMNPQNVRSIWIYSSGGNLEFEFEVDPSIDLNQQAHAMHSKNKHKPNFVEITEPSILRIIEENLENLDVCGARGRGIIVGEIEIPFGTQKKSLVVMSTLQDWKDYIEDKKFSL